MSGFWHWFIAIITVASLLGCLWLLFANARGTPGEADTGHVWDGDLREYNNPLPRWWLNLFIITVVFGIGYLVVYPGLGNFAGTFGWTQDNQLEEKLAAVQQKRQAMHAQFKGKEIAALVGDPNANALGRELFLNNCAGCHGADARGALGFPNLADRDWLYGGEPEQVLASIRGGRQGVMPPFGAAIGPEVFDDLVTTVARWSDPKLDGRVRERAMKQYGITCAVCHGAEGKGNPLLGAPDLTDDIWLHGGAREHIRESVMFGRKGNMPAHDTLLSAEDIRVLTAYVLGLSQAP